MKSWTFIVVFVSIWFKNLGSLGLIKQRVSSGKLVSPDTLKFNPIVGLSPLGDTGRVVEIQPIRNFTRAVCHTITFFRR